MLGPDRPVRPVDFLEPGLKKGGDVTVRESSDPMKERVDTLGSNLSHVASRRVTPRPRLPR